jgi:WD40 repeat protein
MCKSVWFSPDGRVVGASGDGELALYDMATGIRLSGPGRFKANIAKSQACPVIRGGEYGFCVGCENNGDVFYYTGPVQTVQRNYTGSPELSWQAEGNNSPTTGMSFSADGEAVFICYRDGTACSFDTSSGKVIHQITLAQAAKSIGTEPKDPDRPSMLFDDKITVVACGVSGGDQLLACGRNDGISILRAPQNSRKMQFYADGTKNNSQFAGFDSPVSALAFGAYQASHGWCSHLFHPPAA